MAKVADKKKEYPKEFTLSSGVKVRLLEEIKGIHGIKAAEIARNKQGFVPAAIASQVVEIEGKMMAMEDIINLPILDYSEIAIIAQTGSLDYEGLGNE